jgi:hypothetical protein
MIWLRSMLADGVNNSVSSKRVITALAFILCAYGFVADIHGYKVNPALFESMMYIVIAGLGFTASEKFSKQKKESDNSSS